MLAGAYGGFAGAFYTQSIWLGFLIGGLCGAVVAALMALTRPEGFLLAAAFTAAMAWTLLRSCPGTPPGELSWLRWQRGFPSGRAAARGLLVAAPVVVFAAQLLLFRVLTGTSQANGVLAKSWLHTGFLHQPLEIADHVQRNVAALLASLAGLSGQDVLAPLALVVAVPIGTYAGLHPGGLFDRIASGGALVLRATPTFLIAVLLILLVAVELGLAPASGHGHGSHFILPALTLGLALASVLSRVVRNAVVDAVSSEAFRFARQKGLPLFVALRRHALRNAAVPVITYLGVQTALLVEGVVVVESVFSWPGIGHALTHAIFERDVPMLQGTALVLGLGFVLLSFLVDLTCRFIDPRLAE